MPGDPLGGVTVVGDLLLVPLLQGDLLGLDRETGRQKAVLPPPEEQKDVKTAIGAAIDAGLSQDVPAMCPTGALSES